MRAATDGFAVAGAFGTGSIPVAGAGNRMMWYPGKGSFRAGIVTGTEWDDANIGATSFATGFETTASGDYSVAAGWGAAASGFMSIALGRDVTASGSVCTAIGDNAIASGEFCTAMGGYATASGRASTAIGGDLTASGDFSTALGRLASTNGHEGSFVYGDATTFGGDAVNVTADNSFVVRAQRVWFGKSGDQVATAGRYIETSTGAFLSDAGVSSSVSARERKHDFRPADGELALQKIARLPIHNWAYKVEDLSIRHIGPTAQDFYAAFGLGDSDKAIGSVDIDGVNMLAIKALERRTRDLQKQVEAKDQELEQLRAQVKALTQRLQRLEETR